MIALVSTASGVFSVELETEEVEPFDGELEPVDVLSLNLPRLVAAAASGATVFAVVDAKPPIIVSHDAGTTWRESGRGLPAGKALAISSDDPDTAIYAARNRLYVTHDGGVFWNALAVELPEIEAVRLRS